MSRLGLFFTLIVVTASAVAQSSVLTPVQRTPVVGVDERTFSLLMLPIACDEQGRTYARLSRTNPQVDDPLLRISPKGTVEVRFGTTGETLTPYAIRHDGGVVMVRLEGDKFLDYFSPEGNRQSSVRLEVPPIRFFPSQLAVFQSGEIFVAGQQIKPSYKASAAIYAATGSLIKQLTLIEDETREREIANDSATQKLNARAINQSVATAGDDGLVYLMRPTNPALIYAISRDGEVVHTFPVAPPAGAGGLELGLRVINNRIVIQYRRDCGPAVKGCIGSVFAVLDSTSGKTLAVYTSDNREVAGMIACYVPDPDRFFLLSLSAQGHGWDIVEARAKEGSQ